MDGTYRVHVVTATETITSDVQVAFTQTPTTQPLIDEVFCYIDGMVFDLDVKDIEALGGQSPNEFMVSYHTSQADADSGANPLPKQYVKTLGSEIIYVRTTSIQNPNCFDSFEHF